MPIERAMHYGRSDEYNDGDRFNGDDDWNDEIKPASWWGYTWPRSYTMNKVVYTTGNSFAAGGWFASNLDVQVRHNHQWVNVSGTQTLPMYPYDGSATPNRTYVLSFDAIAGDGVRIIGKPGGSATFTFLAELEVYYGTP